MKIEIVQLYHIEFKVILWNQMEFTKALLYHMNQKNIFLWNIMEIVYDFTKKWIFHNIIWNLFLLRKCPYWHGNWNSSSMNKYGVSMLKCSPVTS